jgi:hypothetical protein
MNPYPYAPPQEPYRGLEPRPPNPDDVSQLSALAICHFVYGGLLVFGGFFGLVYAVLGMAIVHSPPRGPNAASIGYVFIYVGAFISLLVWTKAAAVIYSGVCLRRRRSMLYSFVIGCVSLIGIPFGTALGIFTIIVLSRPSVKALYDQAALR